MNLNIISLRALLVGKANNKVFFPIRSTAMIRRIRGTIQTRIRPGGDKLERKKKGNAKRDPKEKKKTKKKRYGAGIRVRWLWRIGIRGGKCLMWVSMFVGKKQEAAAWTLNATLWWIPRYIWWVS
jgi:hypothetical protein